MPELMMNEMIGLMLVVFLFFILVIGFAKFPEVLQFFGFYADVDEAFNLKVARESTDALACAINSVAGRDANSRCLTSFKGGGVKLDEATLRTAKPAVTCQDAAGGTKCTVKNFWLPQKVDGGQRLQWINQFGDPKYLTYWQAFPADENTWTKPYNLKLHLLALTIGLIPIPVGKTKAVAQTTKTVIAEFGEAGAITAVETATISDIKDAVKNTVIKDFLTKAAASGIKKIRLANGVTVEAVALGLAFYESVTGKYEERPGKLVLKTPYEGPGDFPLLQLAGKPIAMQRSVGVFNSRDDAIAHFASPCKIESMDVVPSSNIFCGTYGYKTAGTETCSGNVGTDTETTGYSEPRCEIISYLNYIGVDSFNSFDEIQGMQIKNIIERFNNKGYNNYLSHFSIQDSYIKPQDDGALNAETDNIPDHLFFSAGIRHKIPEGFYSGVLIDSNYDGYIDAYSLSNCNTDGLVIRDIKKLRTTADGLNEGENNYCFDERGGFKKALAGLDNYISVSGTMVSVGAAVGGATGGTAYGILAGSAFLAFGSSYIGNIGAWPGTAA
ncbi:MAG: hypothetical protein HY518_05585 [Candidatus Aenigmarchaeota archaeon]|nr:hypothetical protein [Candidatus Aenigmarchaeota archaeon]